MAKRKKGRKGKRKGRRYGRKGKGRASTKHSVALEGSAAWDLYKVLTTDGLGGAIVKAPFDKSARDSLSAYSKGGLKQNLVANTRELQLVAMVKVGQKIPVVKGPVNMAVNAINSLGRQMGLKGKWKLV